MTADVDIVNQALSAIGTQSTVQSLTEASTEAQHASIHYAPTRDELLRKYRWDFASKQVALGLLAAAIGTPENPSGAMAQAPVPWLYEYAYPVDCLFARRILPLVAPTQPSSIPATTAPASASPMLKGPPVKFKVALDQDKSGNQIKVILTNQTQAILDYTAKVTDPDLFDSTFITALVGRLAAKLVVPLSGDKALAKIAIEDGLQAEGVAAARDGNEGLTVIDHMPDWIRARGYASDYARLGADDFDPFYRID